MKTQVLGCRDVTSTKQIGESVAVQVEPIKLLEAA